MLKKVLISLAAAVVLGFAAWTLSPWPSALFYRTLMDRGGVAMNEALAKHVPAGVIEQRNITYAAGDTNLRLDVFRPAGDSEPARPLIFWVHGGGFISGDKDQIANYLKILASKGYVTAGPNYTLAPGAAYPSPVRQTTAALRHLIENAKQYGIDTSRIILAGDSAGAQITGQLTTIISSPEYASRHGFAPPIPRTHLKGAILHCGLHDPNAIDPTSAFGGFLKAVTWSYFGVADIRRDPRADEMSTVQNVTSGFPPLFISAGNADPLAPQSVELAAIAKAKGVVVDALFFSADYAPALQHEYQFNLDTEAGKLALERMEAFLKRRSE